MSEMNIRKTEGPIADFKKILEPKNAQANICKVGDTQSAMCKQGDPVEQVLDSKTRFDEYREEGKSLKEIKDAILKSKTDRELLKNEIQQGVITKLEDQNEGLQIVRGDVLSYLNTLLPKGYHIDFNAQADKVLIGDHVYVVIDEKSGKVYLKKQASPNNPQYIGDIYQWGDTVLVKKRNRVNTITPTPKQAVKPKAIQKPSYDSEEIVTNAYQPSVQNLADSNSNVNVEDSFQEKKFEKKYPSVKNLRDQVQETKTTTQEQEDTIVIPIKKQEKIIDLRPQVIVEPLAVPQAQEAQKTEETSSIKNLFTFSKKKAAQDEAIKTQNTEVVEPKLLGDTPVVDSKKDTGFFGKIGKIFKSDETKEETKNQETTSKENIVQNTELTSQKEVLPPKKENFEGGKEINEKQLLLINKFNNSLAEDRKKFDDKLFPATLQNLEITPDGTSLIETTVVGGKRNSKNYVILPYEKGSKNSYKIDGKEYTKVGGVSIQERAKQIGDIPMFVASTTNREDIKMLVIPKQPMTPYFEKVQ